MNLETNRLILRKYSIENLQDYYSLKSCRDVWKYSTNNTIMDMDVLRKQLLEIIINQKGYNFGFCALFEKASNNYIGGAGILSINKSANSCVIGYNLLPLYWNKGYATEITKEIIKYAFSILELERIEALAMQLNIASCKVLEKSGLIEESIQKHFSKRDGIYYDVVHYGIVRADYNIK